MNEDRSSISHARTYEEIGEFWDTHEVTEFWDRTEPAEFEVDIRSEVTYFALEGSLAARLEEQAEQRGIAPETLLNLWVQEKLAGAGAEKAMA